MQQVPSTRFVLNRLAPQQAAEAARLYRISYDHAHPWLRGMHTPAEDLDFFSRRVFPTCEVWGAFQGSKLAGLTAFRQGWIEQLYVLPDLFSRGIGSLLLAKALENGERRSLWVFSRNHEACAFYKKRGFEPTSAACALGDGVNNADLLLVGP